MSKDFEELDFQETAMGDLLLRRRRLLALDTEVWEVKLGDSFLMSSMFHEAEVALAKRGLGELAGKDLDVVVGGLGLGYTAVAALESPAVRSLLVVEALKPVIEWHERGLVPLGARLTGDARCRLVHGDFFALAGSEGGFDGENPGRRFHAVLLDIDHSPRMLLHERHGSFYSREGLRRLAGHLHEDGVFAMWSDEAPDEAFLELLDTAFDQVRAHDVQFANPLTGGHSESAVYVARRKG